jgi:hypothetical protein
VPASAGLLEFSLVVIARIAKVAESVPLAIVPLVLTSTHHVPYQEVEPQKVNAVYVSVQVHVKGIEIRHGYPLVADDVSCARNGMLCTAEETDGDRGPSAVGLSLGCFLLLHIVPTDDSQDETGVSDDYRSRGEVTR